METMASLCHSQWECKYHVVIIPKNRKKILFKEIRNYLRDLLRELARQRESQILEGELCVDHVHMLLSIPPKYSVAQVVGYIKGKSAICIARTYLGRRQNFSGQNFWARGYYVSTVGVDEDVIRHYIQNQQKEDNRLEQMKLLQLP